MLPTNGGYCPYGQCPSDQLRQIRRASTVHCNGCGSARIGSTDGLGSRPATVARQVRALSKRVLAAVRRSRAQSLQSTSCNRPPGCHVWNFQSKRNLLRDRMVLVAPEANPHEFVRRYLRTKPQPLLQRLDQARTPRTRGAILDELVTRPAPVA
jgi:hypothetical protein